MDFTVESLFFYNKKVKFGNSEMGHTQKTDGKCWSALM